MMSEKHEVILDLDINSNAPKSVNSFFATDQTPTPTKLYNCEEYGIFEDLKLVNPFDEIFRHAVEKNNNKNASEIATDTEITKQPANQDEDSLHTPQVIFPQLDVSNATAKTAPNPVRQQSTPLITDLVMTDIEPVKKYRAITPKLLTVTTTTTAIVENCNSKSITCSSGNAIPIQTVKPLILPKVETKLKPTTSNQSSNGSPSSASLTPTSQLPIKERLKVILNNNSKTQQALVSSCTLITEKANKCTRRNNDSSSSSGRYNERCMERRRAAATRYRNKMRNEHKELRRRNAELQGENVKLSARIAELEQQLAQRSVSLDANSAAYTQQIHIPPSSIHLVMNIPKLLVPANGPPLLHNPITYKVSMEKK